MDPRFITPLLIAVLVAWGLYRRARRFIGRQTLQPARLWTRIGFLVFAGALVVATSARTPNAIEALLAGACCGIALGWVGLKYTRFESTPEGRFYTPHAYIGLLVTALLAGRVLYRFLFLYSGAQGFAPVAQDPSAFQRSPMTLGIFAALVGYYLSYYLGVLSMSRVPAIAPRLGGAE